VLSADGKGVPMRKPAAAPPIAAHQHQQGPKPGRKKMAVVGAVYQVDRYQRTPEEVVQGYCQVVESVKQGLSRWMIFGVNGRDQGPQATLWAHVACRQASNA
jgi:hypothetical protein